MARLYNIMASTTYVLRLSSGKYYVGKTDNMDRRWKEHLTGTGSAWTSKYPPIAIEKTIRNASPFEEDKVTKEYMNKYGIDNVRGGSYVTEKLDINQRYSINQEIRQATGCCTRCGESGHFVKSCYARTTLKGEEGGDDDEEEGEEGDEEEDEEEEEDEDDDEEEGEEGDEEEDEEEEEDEDDDEEDDYDKEDEYD